MNIVVTGATGWVGRQLLPRLLADGHRPIAWARDPVRARAQLGAAVEVIDDAALPAALASAAAVVNLAGENLFGGRWSVARRRLLVESRLATTRRLVDALRSNDQRPQVLVSASAVGYYGDRGSELLDEQSSAGSDFLARLVVDWEAAAQAATGLGVRVVLPRFGLLLGRGGGALDRLQPLFALGLGGRLGSGAQYMPWLHLDDAIEIIRAALGDERLAGPINAVAPAPVTNREFTAALGRALRRPAFWWVPGSALQLALGDAASVLLASQRVLPRRLEQLGHRFRQPDLVAALRDLVAAG